MTGAQAAVVTAPPSLQGSQGSNNNNANTHNSNLSSSSNNNNNLSVHNINDSNNSNHTSNMTNSGNNNNSNNMTNSNAGGGQGGHGHHHSHGNHGNNPNTGGNTGHGSNPNSGNNNSSNSNNHHQQHHHHHHHHHGNMGVAASIASSLSNNNNNNNSSTGSSTTTMPTISAISGGGPGGAVGGSLVRILSAPKLGIVTPKLGLLGGGETSTSTSQSSGWGAPGPSTSSGGAGSGWGQPGGGGSGTGAPWGAGGEEKQSAGAASWAATAGAHGGGDKGGQGLRGGSIPGCPPDQEDLRRVAAFASGWGQVPINQDTAWDAPASPKETAPPVPPLIQSVTSASLQQQPPSRAIPGSPMWGGPTPTELSQTQHAKGTDIWECSIRQKGSKAPGGGASGVSGSTGAAGGAGLGGMAGTGASGQQGPHQGPHSQGGWQQQQQQQQQQQPPQHTTAASHIGGTWGEEEVENPNSMWTGVPPPSVAPPGMGGPVGGGGFDTVTSPVTSQWPPQGPPPDKQWGGPGGQGGPGGHGGHGGASPHQQGPPPPHSQPWTQPGGMPPQHDATASWSGLKQALAHASGAPAGPGGQGVSWVQLKKEWEPNSQSPGGPNDTSQMPPPPGVSYDDRMRMGTAGWGSPAMPDKVSHWKDMPTPAVPRLVPLQWGGAAAGAGDKIPWWEEEWGAKPKTSSGGPPDWSDGQIDTSTWGGPAKQGGKPLTKELISASQHFRVLTSMGYHKDEVENLLRANNMDMDRTLQALRVTRFAQTGKPKPGMPGGGNPQSHNFSVSQWEPRGPPPPPPLSKQQSQQGPPQQPPQPGPPQAPMRSPMQHPLHPGGPGHPNHQGHGGHEGPVAPGAGASQPSGPGGPGGAASGPNSFGPGPAPSQEALRTLVARIQTAIQAGYLNPQILNQPLAPPTLQLLYQLLSHIRIIDILEMKPEHLIHNPMKHNVQIMHIKQTICSLQNQILAAQAMFLKQQPPPPTGTESRLNQWKLPSPTGSAQGGERESTPGQLNVAGQSAGVGVAQASNGGSKWDHAGTAASGSGNGQSNGQESTGGGGQSQSQPTTDSGASGMQSSMNNNYNVFDIVAEFEPGKPWKGSWNMKSAEDDPHMTPGSVTRNPLVAPGGLKDNNEALFNQCDWQNPSTSSDSSSSTWSAFGSSGSSGVGTTGGQGANSSKKWYERMWHNTPIVNPNSPSSGGPGSTGISSSMHPSGGQAGTNQTSGKNFLVLKNLTAQIDGSTLKTLCMQHGPLQLFHLFLSHGLALIQYQTREEALKAEAALHHCVLSNTTIIAYVPTEAEVHRLLNMPNYKKDRYNQPTTGVQGAAGQQQQQPSPAQQRPPTSSAAPCGWPSFDMGGMGAMGSMGGGAALWGPPEGVGASDNTPLNSFLPGDLLSGESI
ncbi:protein Gawky-like isoform X2 [Varroa jacobsoni]|uniref:protein Gawky-like isoform X2 n=1 Tax=Varroa jacobsoni TaxID=62625 RepID=UPI000BF3E4CF|nr:protein Gawky-like isoform X2 [Varroa jacobsoni]